VNILRQCPSCLLPALRQHRHNNSDEFISAFGYTATVEIVDKLEAEVERLRMQLAACDVIALANTKNSAAKAREGIHPDYISPTLQSVMQTVDCEIELRAEVERLKAGIIFEGVSLNNPDMAYLNNILKAKLAGDKDVT